MWTYRVRLGMALFGLAVICVLLGAGTSAVFGKLALWFGAASFTWQGFRAFLGKLGPSQAQTTALPHPPAGPHCAPPAPANPGGVWPAVKSATVNTARGIARCYIVLVLVVLVPVTLGLAIGGIVTLVKGDALMGGLMCALGGYLGWYLCGPLLTMWRELHKHDHEDDANDVNYNAGSSPEQEAASLQQMCPNWMIIWSSWRRTFTAFPTATNGMVIDDTSAWRLLQRIFEIEGRDQGSEADAFTRSSGPGQPGRQRVSGPAEDHRRRPQIRILPQITDRDSAMSPRDLWRLRKRGVKTIGTVIDHVLPRQPFGKGFDRPVIAFADLQGRQRTMTPDIESRFFPVDEHIPLVYLPDKPQCAKLSSDTSRRSLPVFLIIVLLFSLALFGWLTGMLPTTDEIFAAIIIFVSLGFLASIGRNFQRLSTLHRHGVRTTGTATRMYAKSDVEAGVVIDFFDSQNRRIQFASELESHTVGNRVPVVYLRDDPTGADIDTPLRNVRSLIVPTLICLAFTAAGALILFLPSQPGQ